ncbi:hypothetical protein FB45DRAFT_872899 [Roridomyces roridus]|uniref:Uncharacterized protein n=1 Tax=Roridomyces roridus TaxID=1738132 RepID=A0AAD7FFY3_9AGAR|nr:hypothetical protein FB45DRAFT_872899 [Roridomyces roridus]
MYWCSFRQTGDCPSETLVTSLVWRTRGMKRTVGDKSTPSCRPLKSHSRITMYWCSFRQAGDCPSETLVTSLVWRTRGMKRTVGDKSTPSCRPLKSHSRITMYWCSFRQAGDCPSETLVTSLVWRTRGMNRTVGDKSTPSCRPPKSHTRSSYLVASRHICTMSRIGPRIQPQLTNAGHRSSSAIDDSAPHNQVPTGGVSRLAARHGYPALNLRGCLNGDGDPGDSEFSLEYWCITTVPMVIRHEI